MDEKEQKRLDELEEHFMRISESLNKCQNHLFKLQNSVAILQDAVIQLQLTEKERLNKRLEELKNMGLDKLEKEEMERRNNLKNAINSVYCLTCKDCKYFEDEICKKWGDRCETGEDGYCFLCEPKERD